MLQKVQQASRKLDLTAIVSLKIPSAFVYMCVGSERFALGPPALLMPGRFALDGDPHDQHVPLQRC